MSKISERMATLEALSPRDQLLWLIGDMSVKIEPRRYLVDGEAVTIPGPSVDDLEMLRETLRQHDAREVASV